MERLTECVDSGISVKENYGESSLKTIYQCYGEKPFSNYSNCDEGYCAMEKLAEYEDLEEQGKLLKLPCKVGDEVFIPIDFQNKIHQGIVINIEYSKIRKGFVARIRTVDDDVCYEKFEDFGKTVFLTHEEAENFLAKMIEKDSENR